MSSNPWPWNWASQHSDSDRPKNRKGTLSLYSVCEPDLGMFSGHEVFARVPPDWTSSGMEMSMTPWPPVWEPETPIRP